MTSILVLLNKDLKILIAKKSTFITLVIFPIVIILIFSGSMGFLLKKNILVEPFPIAVVDKDSSLQSEILINQIRNIKLFSNVKILSESVARKEIMENKIASAIIIPEGFINSVITAENKSIHIIENGNMKLESAIVKKFVDSAGDLINAGQGALYSIYHFYNEIGLPKDQILTEFDQMAGEIVIKSLSRKDVIEKLNLKEVEEVTPAEYFTASLLTLILMFAGLPIAKGILIERLSGITTRIYVSGDKKLKYIFSKVLLLVIFLSIQVLVVFVFSTLALNTYFGFNKFDFIIILISSIISISCFSIFIAFISNSFKTFDLLGSLVILLLAIFGGSIYPLTTLPEWIVKMSDFTINKWIANSFIELFSGDKIQNVWRLSLNIILSGLIFLILTIILSFKNRKEMRC